ncbi:hypothetical protein GGX14DRAFT_596380 [Mycena pura]|uniref:Uncharacterized protein n=1 Tax=Mycena pura TaxID=153505 RepID=A0AAD6UWW5_9AGAR|nr:hypothetical protein GGX14DRAFT_596380 [Mycena pura]
MTADDREVGEASNPSSFTVMMSTQKNSGYHYRANKAGERQGPLSQIRETLFLRCSLKLARDVWCKGTFCHLESSAAVHSCQLIGSYQWRPWLREGIFVRVHVRVEVARVVVPDRGRDRRPGHREREDALNAVAEQHLRGRHAEGGKEGGSGADAPPGVDYGALPAADVLVVPLPGLRIDGLADGVKDTEGRSTDRAERRGGQQGTCRGKIWGGEAGEPGKWTERRVAGVAEVIGWARGRLAEAEYGQVGYAHREEDEQAGHTGSIEAGVEPDLGTEEDPAEKGFKQRRLQPPMMGDLGLFRSHWPRARYWHGATINYADHWYLHDMIF